MILFKFSREVSELKSISYPESLIFYDMIKFHKEFDPINIELMIKFLLIKKIKYIKNQALKLGLKLVSA